MMRVPVILILLFLFTGCESDYTPDSSLERSFRKQPVVNSLLIPGSTIKIALFWSRAAGSKLPYQAIEGAAVELKEDARTIFTGVSANDVMDTGIYPGEGKTYSITVNVPGEKTITASTIIPGQSSLEGTTRYNVYTPLPIGSGQSKNYLLVDVSRIDVYSGSRALWLSLNYISTNMTSASYPYELYSNCPFIDQINAARDGTDAQLRESNMLFEDNFIRIPRSGFKYICPFTFSAWGTLGGSTYHYDPDTGKETNLGDQYLTHIEVNVLTPSDEYDQYMRSAYKMGAMMTYGSPLQEGTETVFSNIENGLGIFAGYNINKIALRVDNPLIP